MVPFPPLILSAEVEHTLQTVNSADAIIRSDCERVLPRLVLENDGLGSRTTVVITIRIAIEEYERQKG